eukprot:m.58377 g.58377  ORF g.58377 m.58377 type:complete len:810 (+) comp11178_c0_seq1:90-2519(+)
MTVGFPFVCFVFFATASIVSSANNNNNNTVNPLSVNKVHLVWSNHLDLGFADFVTNVMNRYFTGGIGTCAPPLPRNQTMYYKPFFELAINNSEYFRMHPDLNMSFSYMTQSFLIEHFLSCNASEFPFQNFHKQHKLRCPTPESVTKLEQALRDGDIYFHAFPHDAQPELMDSESFAALGLTPAATLASRFGLAPPKVLSLRDVPGLTRGIVPVLVKNNVTGISIGANDGSPPPIVPSVFDCYVDGKHQVRTPFVWRDEASDTEVIMDIHPGGYGGVTGGSMPNGIPFFSRDGTLCDCLGVAGFDEVMCTTFRGDNYGPNGTEQVKQDFKVFSHAFPNAKIERSTFDAFYTLLESRKNLLPTLTSEIGDTWMYGVSSDPLKVAQMRAMMRAGTATGYTEATPIFKRYAIKLSEHTWGAQGGLHNNITHPTNAWTVQELAHERMVNSDPYYQFMEDSWDEQRAFIKVSTEALPPDSKMAEMIAEEFEAISAPVPTEETLKTAGYIPVAHSAWEEMFKFGDYEAKFNISTGGIASFVEHNGASQIEWADFDNQLATFMYRSHSYEEACEYGLTYNYNHGGQYPYNQSDGCPTDGMNNTKTMSKHWYYPVKDMWIRDKNNENSSIVLQLEAPNTIRSLGYGGPVTVFVTFSVSKAKKGLEVELVWDEKAACFLPESSWFEFKPKLATTTESEWKLYVDKMGRENIDASDVVGNGGAVLHGVDPVNAGIAFKQINNPKEVSKIRIESLDAGLVAPGYVRNTWDYKAYDSKPVSSFDGAAFNLHSNLYDTNYVVYYPWRKEESMSRFRFLVITEP